jgi:hypothetical protein
MRWSEHVAQVGEKRNVTKFWKQNLKKGDHKEEWGIEV